MGRTRVDVVVPAGVVAYGPCRYRGWLDKQSQQVVYRTDTDGGCGFSPPMPWNRLQRWQWMGPVDVMGVPDLVPFRTMREAIEGARDER